MTLGTYMQANEWNPRSHHLIQLYESLFIDNEEEWLLSLSYFTSQLGWDEWMLLLEDPHASQWQQMPVFK